MGIVAQSEFVDELARYGIGLSPSYSLSFRDPPGHFLPSDRRAENFGCTVAFFCFQRGSGK